jgi:hypothetical protein
MPQAWGAKRRRTRAWTAGLGKCARAAALDWCRPRVGPLMTQSSGPTRTRSCSSSLSCSSPQPQPSMPTSRRRPPLPRRTRRHHVADRDRPQQGPALPECAARLATRSRSAHAADGRAHRHRGAHDGDDLLHLRRISRIAQTPCSAGGRPAWNPGIVAGDRGRPARSSSSSDVTPSFELVVEPEDQSGRERAHVRRRCRCTATAPRTKQRRFGDTPDHRVCLEREVCRVRRVPVSPRSSDRRVVVRHGGSGVWTALGGP